MADAPLSPWIDFRRESWPESTFHLSIWACCLRCRAMARKESSDKPREHGFGEVVGIALAFTAFLLLVALLSYDHRDVPANSTSYNKFPSNWIGLFGAWIGYGLFLAFGAAAYLSSAARYPATQTTTVP